MYYLICIIYLHEKQIDLGGKGKYFLNASLIRNCNKSSVSQYTCDLLSVMFTKEELASCSLTGKIPNTMKGTATKAKPRLDPNRIEAIEGKDTNITVY